MRGRGHGVPGRSLPHAARGTLRRRAGLARPEMVFLLALALMIFSLVIPGWFAWQRRARFSAARLDLTVLSEAARRFYSEYGIWPATSAGGTDARFGQERPNSEVMNALLAIDGPGNQHQAVNPNSIVFLEAPHARSGISGLDSDGNFVDPWGTPYQIVLDIDLNNACDVPKTVYSNMVGEGFIAWSCGPDRISDTADDILSWKARREVKAGGAQHH